MPQYNKDVQSLSYADIEEAVERNGSERKAAWELGVPRTTLQARRKKLREEKFSYRATRKPVKIEADKTRIKRFIFTSAQDDTAPDQDFWQNLRAYAKFRDADIFISGFTYNKSLFEDHSTKSAIFHPDLKDYITQEQIHLGDGIAFCGEMNTLPTAVRPLSGLETYTQDKWGIFPHAKIQLKSIPTAKSDPVKVIMTTGTVTKSNYIQKKAGIKAEHYHEIGAVIVELLPDGRFFVRHLLAGDDGSFYDLTFHVQRGKVTGGHTTGGWNAPDVHVEKASDTVTSAIWAYPDCPGFPALIDYLKPAEQFIHDVSDFDKRNHHNIDDPHFMYEAFINKNESVEEGIEQVGSFLQAIRRTFMQTVVVESNHDLALLKWLKKADYRKDPVNAQYFLYLQHQVYKAISEKKTEFQILKWAIQDKFDLYDVIFLHEDDSYTIVGNIECGLHGHLGANGSKASPGQFARMGRKSNTGHTHTASIEDGNYCSGVTSLEMGYNKGLSSWSVSGTLTYNNGKRTILFFQEDGLYCGDVWELTHAKH